MLIIADPDDNEIACRIRSHDGAELVARRIGVDAELRTEGGARAVVTLRHDTEERPILQRVAAPDDDEVPRVIDGNGVTKLITCRIRVDPELGAERVRLVRSPGG